MGSQTQWLYWCIFHLRSNQWLLTIPVTHHLSSFSSGSVIIMAFTFVYSQNKCHLESDTKQELSSKCFHCLFFACEDSAFIKQAKPEDLCLPQMLPYVCCVYIALLFHYSWVNIGKWDWYKTCLRDSPFLYCAMLQAAETLTLMAVTDRAKDSSIDMS